MKHEKPIPMKPGGKAMPPKVNHDRVDSKKKKKNAVLIPKPSLKEREE